MREAEQGVRGRKSVVGKAGTGNEAEEKLSSGNQKFSNFDDQKGVFSGKNGRQFAIIKLDLDIHKLETKNLAIFTIRKGT